MSKRLVAAPRNFHRRAATLVTIFTLALGTTHDAKSQSSNPNAMQGFVQNRDQPIQIEADALEVRDKVKQATFSGNVKVVQGDTTMTSKSLDVFYTAAAQSSSSASDAAKSGPPLQSASPGPSGSSAIRRLEARGDVVVTQKDQVVTGQSAVFDTKTNLITMLGGVVVTQCRNVLRGDRLLVDMTTGVSRVESNGKVTASVNQSSEAGCGAPSVPPGPASKKK
ncbi:LptA/OstA family protein [Bradyrhizobium ontarionense]|uniref:LptA/OstA family protein n=1 Tax=Bradyrhizobium ontarionense TaxID=2898149 RepID=A0ABY3RM54_9BRAD|nr:LptA/OstA family protein [Bradyrhizobium sp. A19]UFZ07818.1 LptA/OstA family protein [Bradyrhizobium sp. A19]